MVRPNKRIAGGLAAFAVTAGGLLAFAPQAHAAGPANTQVSCAIPDDVKTYMGGKSTITGAQKFTVTGPATVTAGQAIKLKVDPGPSPASSPPVPATVKVTSTMDFKTNTGATITATSAVGSLTLPAASAPLDIAPFDLSVTVPAAAKDKFELSPTKFSLKIEVPEAGLTIAVPCTTTSTAVAYSATIPGTGTGSTPKASTTPTTSSTPTARTTTPAATSAGAGDTLPKTGPLDDALSMGLLGGTVGLLGIGGVLLATRRVRAQCGA
jgi:hypothetical protein